MRRTDSSKLQLQPADSAAKPSDEPKLPAHVHPDDRARLAALGALTKPLQAGPEISYYSPELIQCTLPHSEPPGNPWIRKNGNFSLIVSSGFDGEGSLIGIPYGAFPRLTLAHIITRVVATQERHIDLGSHFATFLTQIGYTSNHRGQGIKGQRVRDQLLRLIHANISYTYSGGTAEQGQSAGAFLHLANSYALWWNFKKPEQGSLFGSWLELSEDFYRSILRAPVPLRTDILKALKKSPLALDVYMWVSYRLFGMQASGQQELNVHYGLLQAQFGTGIDPEKNYRKFRQEFKLAFAKVAEYWQPHEGDQENLLLNYELDETGLTLYRSKLLIGRGQRRTAQEDAQQIITTRTFDQATRKQARVLAEQWSVDYLASQYFDWIEKQGIIPKDPRAHFLEFIKSHRKQHG